MSDVHINWLEWLAIFESIIIIALLFLLKVAIDRPLNPYRDDGRDDDD